MARFSPYMLTEVRKKGCNALGVFELALCMAPILVQQFIGADVGPHGAPQPVTTAARLAVSICAAAAAGLDLFWRWRHEPDPRWWIKATSADAGGALVFIPGWSFATFLLGLAVWAAIVSPATAPPHVR